MRYALGLHLLTVPDTLRQVRNLPDSAPAAVTAGEDIRERTDALDAAGNTTAAIGKGFAIGSAALVSLALFGAYITRSKIDLIESSILDPKVSLWHKLLPSCSQQGILTTNGCPCSLIFSVRVAAGSVASARRSFTALASSS